MKQILEFLKRIENTSKTIYQAITKLEDGITNLRRQGDPQNKIDQQQLALLETVLKLIQKPESEVADREEREINFEVAAQEATYISPDSYL